VIRVRPGQLVRAVAMKPEAQAGQAAGAPAGQPAGAKP